VLIRDEEVADMKGRFYRLSCLWFLLAMPAAASTNLIYATNSAGTTIDVIDPATNKVVQVIKDMEGPEVARFSPDGSRVYITTSADNFLIVMDRKTGKEIKRILLSGWVNDAAVTKDGKLIVVCIRNVGNTSKNNTGALDVIDTASLEKVNSIPVKSGLHDIDLTGDSKYAVASSPEGKSVTVFDLQSRQVAWDITFDEAVQTLTVGSNADGSGSRIFVNLFHLDGFIVVDFATHKIVTTIKNPPGPAGFGQDNFHSASHGTGVAPDRKTLWVNSRPSNCFFVYSLPDLKVVGTIPLHTNKLPGHEPTGAVVDWLTFTSDSKTAYLSNGALNSVSAIDMKTFKEVALIPVGEVPHRISTLVIP
jgi:DNA-binding beta-propeller fold protein YncE